MRGALRSTMAAAVGFSLVTGGVSAASAGHRRIDPTLDATNVRHDAFEGDLLKTTLTNASGVTTATATWKRSNDRARPGAETA